jgi:hypothetical protein
VGTRSVPFQRVDRRLGNIGVRALVGARESHLDVVRDGFHASNAVGRLFGRPSLGVGVHNPGERDDAVLDHNADLIRLDQWLPSELRDDVGLNLRVGACLGSNGHD